MVNELFICIKTIVQVLVKFGMRDLSVTSVSRSLVSCIDQFQNPLYVGPQMDFPMHPISFFTDCVEIHHCALLGC
jgi:hypothetical protein